MMSVMGFAQNGYSTFFYDGLSNVSSETPESFTLENNNGLNINVSAGGYENVIVAFSSIDISANPTVIVGVEASSDFTFRMDLVDAEGKITNTNATQTSITADGSVQLIEFDFTGKFNQSFPNGDIVDPTNISQAFLFFNPGGSYNGDVTIERLIIGDAVIKGAEDKLNGSELYPGWKSDNSYSLSAENASLKVEANVQTGSADLFQFYPGENMDLSADASVSFKAKANSAANVQVMLVDVFGNSTYSSTEFLLDGTSEFQDFSYDFTSELINQQTANGLQIVGVEFVVNPVSGSSSFSGTIHIDDVVIGNGEKTVSPPISGNLSEDFLINQVGYELNGPKRAVYRGSEVTNTFQLISLDSELAYEGSVISSGSVNGWGPETYTILDFSDFAESGEYLLKVGNDISYSFVIEENILFNQTGFAPIEFFYGMRSEDEADRTLSFNGPRTDEVNVYGGWWDANGDPGKHMSHLSYANHFNPQQIPMVVWSMLTATEQNDFGSNTAAVEDEISWGIDYLIRNIDPEGYLYLAIFDNWGGAPGSREITEWGQPGADDGRTPNYQAAMREGAGIAIAALAKGAGMDAYPDARPQDLIDAAETLYNHLKAPGDGYATKNLEYCNNHEENIIDLYCGLLAATELYKATQNDDYLTDAESYATRLLALQGNDGELYSDEAKNRPFYHAADEGLPVVALSEYSKISGGNLQSEISAFMENWTAWYYALTYEVNNPFDYVREYYKPYTDVLGTAQSGFFVPKDNETGYWWQGENARLASMTTALLTAQKFVHPNYNFGTDSVSVLAQAQLDWVLGKNPFSTCMMFGYGNKNYPSYLNGAGNKKSNIKGGICNGISSTLDNQTEPAFIPFEAANWQNWRWIEQWLPHDAWYLLAVSKLDEVISEPYEDCYGDLGGSAIIDSCGDCTGGNTGLTPNFEKGSCVTASVRLDEKIQLTVAPNPSNSTFSIYGSAVKVRAEVYSINGMHVESLSKLNNFGANYAAGMYIVQVYTAEGKQVLKLIKE